MSLEPQGGEPFGDRVAGQSEPQTEQVEQTEQVGQTAGQQMEQVEPSAGQHPEQSLEQVEQTEKYAEQAEQLGDQRPDHPEPPEHQWRRLHPLSPLLRGGLVLIVLAGIVIANMRDRIIELFVSQQVRDAMQNDGGDIFDLVEYLSEQRLLIWALAGVLLVLLLIIGLSWLSWRYASFRITPEAVEARRGVLFRQHRRAPLERIQSVNLQRSLPARMLGLTAVEVQTAGMGGKVSLQFLGHREAKLVREQILLAAAASKRPSERPAEHAGAGVAVDFAGQAYAPPVTVLDERIGDIADFDIDPAARESGSLIKVPLGRLVASILLGSEMMTMAVLIVLIAGSTIWLPPFALAGLLPVAIVVVSLMISQFNKGFNFVLSRSADGVRIGAGLTATMTETIPFGRVHAVEALQPLGWRPFGWWKVRMTTAGHSLSQGGQNKMQNVVLPVGDIDDVVRVFETLLHDAEGDEDRAAAEQHRAALLRDALVGAGTGFLGAGPRAGWVLWFGRRRAGLRIEHIESEHASLRIRRGAVIRRLSVMPILRAQSMQLYRPLVHRMLGLATLTAHTVLGPVQMRMRGLELGEAREAFDVLASAVVRVQGAEAERRASPGTGETEDAPGIGGTGVAGASGVTEAPGVAGSTGGIA